MSSKVVVFGTGNVAELAHYYLTNDSDKEVVAFAVERDYLKESEKFGLPVVCFDEVEELYPPSDHMFFAPCSGTNLNRYRERIYNESKAKGYQMYSYISSKATVLTDDIGDNCFIMEDNTIQPFVSIGNNCVLWSGNHIGHHSTVRDHVFITSHVVVCGLCDINSYCWIGVNSSIRDGTVLAEGTVVAMSSNITKNTEGNTIYLGIPGKPYKKCDETIVL